MRICVILCKHTNKPDLHLFLNSYTGSGCDFPYFIGRGVKLWILWSPYSYISNLGFMVVFYG